jgi:ribonuclease Z
MTRTSCGTLNFFSVSAAWDIVSQSDFDPMMMPTSGCITLPDKLVLIYSLRPAATPTLPMPEPTPRIENAPYLSLRHGGLTVEGWSRAGIQSYWRIPELRIGFDLGGIPWDFTPVATWFISHAHIDHLMALPGLLARRGMLKFPAPAIHVPAEIADAVRNMLAAWEALDGGKLTCEIIGLKPGERVELPDDRYVSAFPTAHPVPSRGYVVWERRFKLKPEYVGVPGAELKRLRDSGTVATIEVSVPLVCYTGDTGPAGLDADSAVYEAKILIVEMSFARPEHSRERIHAFGHLHLDDFVERADRFRNELIIAAHVTSRDEPASFQRWANDRLPAGLRERVRVWGA